MTNLTIIGTGNMGQAIAELATRGGHSVQSLDTGTPDEEVTGDIVVLAVYYSALAEVVEARGASLAGKVVVDITNPVDMTTFDGLLVPADSSAAAELAERLPESKVLKAFNTTFAPTVGSGRVGDQTTTVLIAGDDADAKAALAEVVRSGGLNVIDAGSLKRARELEAMGFLAITLGAAEKLPWTGGLGVHA